MSEPPTRRPTPAAWNAVHNPVELRAVAADQVTRASPRTGSSAFSTLAGAEVGLWHMTAGGMLDVEVDEVFIVVDGEATLTLLSGDREGESIALHPGVLCRLEAGQRTRWDVPVHVRKVYVTAGDGGIQDSTSGSEPR